MLEQGFETRFFPQIIIKHKTGPSDLRSTGKSSYYIARNWLYFLAEFIPLTEISSFLPFFGKNMIKQSIKKPLKLRYYLLGTIMGILTLWRILPRRKTVRPDTLKRIKAGILGINGYVNPW